ncbi:hypothetical protein U0070_011800 [Myodes glareolus]|uniref:Uncharacterized protein n=1 Tax=Myodes glareolus TaxID=447135 RepID=A0AAW0I2Q9_MYOGA
MMFAGRVPKAAEVSALGSGDKGFGYKGSSFRRIIPGFFGQGSNFTLYGDIGGNLSGWMAWVFGRMNPGRSIAEAMKHFGSRNSKSSKVTIANHRHL